MITAKPIPVIYFTAPFLKRLFQLITVIFLLPACLFAQGDGAAIVRDFSKKNYVQPYIGTFNRLFQFITKEKKGGMHNLRFSPNAASFAGVSVNYKKLSIYLEAGIPNTSKVDKRKTNVKAYSLFVHHFRKSFGVTGFISWNKGLLMSVPSPSMYADRNDLRMLTLGAHFYKIFNGEKFSYTAANSMARLQTKSRGSFIIMTTPMFRRLSSQVSIIPDSVRQFHLNGTSDPSKSLQFISLQCRPGYIYNLVFKGGKYFFAPAFYAGAGAELHTVKTDKEQHADLNFSTGFRMKITTGINGKKCYVSLEYLMDNTTTYLYKTNIKNTYTEISCNLGLRF